MLSTGQKEKLTSNQKKLIALMSNVVEEYYKANAPSQEIVESVLSDNIEEIQAMMGRIQAGITQEENKQMHQAIDASDQTFNL